VKSIILSIFAITLALPAIGDTHRDFFDTKKLLASNPDDPNLRVRHAQLALVTGNYAEAAEAFQWIVTNNVPDWVEWATFQSKILPVLGKSAPNFEGKDLESWTVKKGDYESRIVLIHFWSATDGVSIGSLTQLVDLSRKYKNNPYFSILSVSLDTDQAGVRQAVAAHKLTWPQMFEGKGRESPTAKAYQIQTTPSLALVDADGNLRYVGAFLPILTEAVDTAVERLDQRKKSNASEVRLTPRSKDNKAFCVRPVEILSPVNTSKVLTKLKPGALVKLGKLDPVTGLTAVTYDDPETGGIGEGLVRLPADTPK
jgi:hypothetical protein